MLTAIGAALATAGPSALGAYLVASAVDVGIAEGTAGLLAAVGSALSLAVRLIARRAGRPPPRLRVQHGGRVLLAAGSAGFALLASRRGRRSFVAGALLAFTLGWGWPGLFNLAVVDRPRGAGRATGVSQTGIYVGAGGRPGRVRRALRAGDGYERRVAGRGRHDAAVGRRAVARAPRGAPKRAIYELRGLTILARV